MQTSWRIEKVMELRYIKGNGAVLKEEFRSEHNRELRERKRERERERERP